SAPRNAAGPRADAKRNDAGRPQGRAPGETGAARAPAPARNRPVGNGTRGVLLGK
ncbi:RNA helicase, partial [Bordetella bronchiseptica]